MASLDQNDAVAGGSTSTDAAGGMRNASAPTPSVYPPPESHRPTLVGQHYMVSAGHPIVAQLMANVLERGGTAIDAGIAGGFASAVIQPDMCNLGGIAPIILRRAGEATMWTTPGVGPWGREVTLDGFQAKWGGDIPLGPATGVVPGAPDALLGALARFGTWSFSDLVAPLIDYARDGLVLDHRTAIALKIMGRSFADWESSRAVYWPKGRAPAMGEIIRQTDLAATLEAMAAAETGVDRQSQIEAARAAFYDGPIAEAMTQFNRANGGTLSREDFANFRPGFATAPEVEHGGWRVGTSDFTTQGPVLLQTLGILRQFDLKSSGAGTADTIHTVVEALKLAFADREAYYCDPAFARTDLMGLLSDAYLSDLAGRIRTDKAMAPKEIAKTGMARPRFDTTYVCAVDAAGNAISVMPSDTLDGSPIVPGIGAMISCRGVQSRLDPDHANSLAPGKRPRITPAPALALRQSETGDEVLGFGCPGGDMIIQAMLQGFLNLTVHGMLPQQAVEAPRVASFSFPNSFFPNPAFPNRVDVEARIGADVRADLAARGHDLHDWPDWEFDAGAVMMAGKLDLGGGDGPALYGAADPRRIAYATGR